MTRRKPTVRVFHRNTGWATPDFTDLADCTTNFHREQDGRPPCTETAVWKVVEDHGMHSTIGFYCDTDLPAKHRARAKAAVDTNGWPGDEHAEPGTRGWTA